jgi:hypothetical protein
MLLPLSTPVIEPCEACAQATLAAVQTQEKGNADAQFAATAEILRADAQSTLNSANATLNVAQTQQQNNNNIIAAQIAATAEIVRANALATLNSAGSTQIAAMTQSQYNLQVTELAGTQSAMDMLAQQNKNDLAAGTQTAIADTIATQTQVAAATSQWYTDQDRQRNEQRQGPITFMLTWCLPIFIVLFAVVLLWGFRSWLNTRQTTQIIVENPVDRLPAQAVQIPHHHHASSLPYIESDIIENGYEVTTPDDQIHQWLDEVKDTLRSSDEKKEENDPDN